LTSHDALFGGRVVLHQPARGEGYRVNVDALLLAAFAAAGRRARLAVDLGAGAGAVGLALLHADAAARLVLVEIDPRASDAAQRNLEANRWAERGEVKCIDVAALEPLGADLVVANPPYVEPGRGRPPKGPEKARARSGALARFTQAARKTLGRGGRACFVYPARELLAVLSSLRETGLEPKRLRAVHSHERAPARVVLVEAQAAKPGGLVVEAPLIERGPGGYTAEVRAILDGVLTVAPRGDRGRSRTPRAR
jgi:tRNA1Val (adenine37-N6)-methyltransferase